MRQLKTFLLLFLVACTGPAVEWSEGEVQADGRAHHGLVLKNVPGGSRVWFQVLYDNCEVVQPEGLSIQHFQGTSCYIDIPADAPKTLDIVYSDRPLPRHSWAPEGFLLQQKGKADKALPVTYKFLEHTATPIDANWFAARYKVQAGDMIPRPKVITYGAEVPASKSERPKGWYRITISGEEVGVWAIDKEGEIYAQETLDKLGEELPDMVIEDWPDLGLRGFNFC